MVKILHSIKNSSSHNGVAKSQSLEPGDEKTANLRKVNIS